MHAAQGDWLLIRSHTEGGHLRRAEIMSTHTAGDPPFKVRWLDDDTESVIFPGPDAQIVSAADQAEVDRHGLERMTRRGR